ncbi:MAG: penicillin-binding transpeptidase domain-containing protein [Opitutaceae bacterium]|jgi:penicillin-binding protein 2
MSGTGSERSGTLVETHKGYDPRVIVFYLFIALLLLTLIGGLAYQQLLRTDIYHESERRQNQRRVLVPGPRGNIYDRDGRLLVTNRPRFAVTLYLGELRRNFRTEYIRIHKAYVDADDKDRPSSSQMERIARYTVVQRYLDQVNRTLGRDEKLDADDLDKHFHQQLLLPYLLLDDLEASEYAKLIEQLPVTSPLQVYVSSIRDYPIGSIAAQTLGYVTANDAIEAAEDFPGAELTTFKMKGTIGREGLEARFDSLLQGETGGAIYRVDPAGYRVNPPLSKRQPIHGHDVHTSLDADLQIAAEKALVETELNGAAVAIDIRTGEVLALASKPDYNLTDFIPRLNHAKAKEINDQGAWLNRAVSGIYPPGSTFKIVTSSAGLATGGISAEDFTVDCVGSVMIAGRRFTCENGHGIHGVISLREAIAVSCDSFFYKFGIATTAEKISAMADRFHLDRPTGIDLPYETKSMLIPDAAWKKSRRDESWFPGDTANMSIGQGFIGVTPLQMACFVASFARNETVTRPYLLHDPDRPAQHSEPIGLTPEQHKAIVDGMVGCVEHGTARLFTTVPAMRIPGLTLAGKTGTAQVHGPQGNLNVASFICFAPVENPQIAIAVMVEGNVGEETGGGRMAGPVAQAILKKWDEKRKVPPSSPLLPPTLLSR